MVEVYNEYDVLLLWSKVWWYIYEKKNDVPYHDVE